MKGGTGVALLCAVAGLAVCEPAFGLQIRTLSNRADLVSGGDVLVEVAGAGAGLHVTAGGADVTAAFARVAPGRARGLVTGLPLGRSALVARSGPRASRLVVTNHPAGGPVFAGPQIQPWICETEARGLGRPRDAQCTVTPRVTWHYRPANPLRRGFVAFDPSRPPADVATTTTDQGRRVPFVVRVETGVLDRGIYAFASLADPRRPLDPREPPRAWNRKVVWPFGGDCKPWHRQDVPPAVLGEYPLDPDLEGLPDAGIDEAIGGILGNQNALEALGRGFAVASSGLNRLGSNCNTVVSAEALMMVKERLIETLGPLRYVIGAGSSGGAAQQHQIASSYPGLLDGLQPAASFPDIWSTVQEALDCHLLNRAFDSGLLLAPHQQDAITGYLGPAGCRLQFDGLQLGLPGGVTNYASTWAEPSNALGCGLPADQVYDARERPRGVRCTLQDHMVSIFGRRAVDGFANRPYDNVGVQYGLRALESGVISPQQFAELNARVGGLDIDWRPQARRSQADPTALDVLQRSGLLTHGAPLERVPIVDIRGHDNVEIHSDVHSHALRARLDRDNGHHDNQVIWTSARPLLGDPRSWDEAFGLVDRWLARVEADRRPGSLAQKVRRSRPRDAQDACWVEGRRVTDRSTCRALFPYWGDPRQAAGGTLAGGVLKCTLRPLHREDHPVAFTDAQWERLREAFPDGVCDTDRRGVGAQAPQPWTTYAEGSGGRALGPPPRSRPLHRRRGR